MADQTDVIIENEEDLIKKQKSEVKALQSKIQKLKHSVPKGDKKRKKEVTLEIEQLEADLKKKHDAELLDFQSRKSECDVKTQEGNGDDCTLADEVEGLAIGDEGTSSENNARKKKKSKAKRRKERKLDEEHARQDRIEAYEEESQNSSRNIEAAALKNILDKRDLMIYEIPSDGNCLYAAVVDQLNRQGISSSISSLRKQTAATMRANPDDYLPFLTHHETGLPLTDDDQFEIYLNELESTPVWGGQVEIRALSTFLEQPIEVVQADGPCIHTGEEYIKQSIILSYHRHIYGLGEHFNSVIPRVIQEEEFTTVT